ncbi:MAG: AlpA family transcriptional regulator [Pseudomonadota bacterium]
MSKILKLPDVINLTALSRSSIYAFIQKGIFPKPIRLGERSVGWKSDEITTWIEQRSELRGGAK